MLLTSVQKQLSFSFKDEKDVNGAFFLMSQTYAAEGFGRAHHRYADPHTTQIVPVICPPFVTNKHAILLHRAQTYIEVDGKEQRKSMINTLTEAWVSCVS